MYDVFLLERKEIKIDKCYVVLTAILKTMNSSNMRSDLACVFFMNLKSFYAKENICTMIWSKHPIFGT